MSGDSEVAVAEQADGLIRITIERAHKHNALAGTVLGALARAVADAGARPGTRLLLIRGAGERFFAAGGDLVELSAVRDAAAVDAMVEHSRGALDAVRRCPVPVAAYLNGDAIGGGAELAVACDLRLQAAHARIGYIQSRLAISTAWGGGTDLCQLVGSARALRMMARGEMIEATLAVQWGLADAVISDDADGEDLRTFLAPLLACPVQVLRAIKAQTRAWRDGLAFGERREIERRHLQTTWLHDDHWEAADRVLRRPATASAR